MGILNWFQVKFDSESKLECFVEDFLGQVRRYDLEVKPFLEEGKYFKALPGILELVNYSEFRKEALINYCFGGWNFYYSLKKVFDKIKKGNQPNERDLEELVAYRNQFELALKNLNRKSL